MNISKNLIVGGFSVSFALSAVADGEIVDLGSRSLYWQYPAESTAYESPDNWAVGSQSGEPATESPNGKDTVRFYRASCTAASVNTVVLSQDAYVSNFIYDVEGDAGSLTVDLNGYELCVSNNATINTRSYAANSMLTIRDGTFRVVGKHEGGKTWGAPNEDYGGFYINRQNHQNKGGCLTVDNAKILSDTTIKPAWRWVALQGRHHYLTFTNGAEWVSSNLAVTADSGAHILFSGKNTLCSVQDGKFNTGSDSYFNAALGAGATMTFNDGARLVTGIFRPSSSGTFLFDGGVHELWGVSEGATRGAMVCSSTVILTNGAAFATSKKTNNNAIKVESGAFLKLSENCVITSCQDNCSFTLGEYSTCVEVGPTVEVDGGMIRMPWINVGLNAQGSNSILRIKGPKSLVKQTSGTEWGSDREMRFSYGARIEFEIPAEGYHDENGTPRAPIQATGCFGSLSSDISRPIGIKLSHRTYDRAHPQETLTLMSATKVTDRVAGHDTRAFYEKLLENVFWENAYHGELSVSEDGKSLLYTAPPKRGLMLILR